MAENVYWEQTYKYASDLEGKILFKKIQTLDMILFSLNKYKQNCVVYIWYYSLGISTRSRTDRSIFLSPRRVSPFLAWVIFTRPCVSLTLLMGTTRSLRQGRQLVEFAGFRDFNNCSSDLIMIYSSHFFNSSLWSRIAFLPI